MADYFLVSISNRQNLELCMEYSMAGFTNSINGLWTFFDIEVRELHLVPLRGEGLEPVPSHWKSGLQKRRRTSTVAPNNIQIGENV